MVILGAVIGGFIGALTMYLNSKKGLSDKQIAKFEKKNGRTMTEEDKTAELLKLQSDSKKSLIFSIVLLIIYIIINVVFYMI